MLKEVSSYQLLLSALEEENFNPARNERDLAISGRRQQEVSTVKPSGRPPG